jgi:hypothetical protein
MVFISVGLWWQEQERTQVGVEQNGFQFGQMFSRLGGFGFKLPQRTHRHGVLIRLKRHAR